MSGYLFQNSSLFWFLRALKLSLIVIKQKPQSQNHPESSLSHLPPISTAKPVPPSEQESNPTTSQHRLTTTSTRDLADFYHQSNTLNFSPWVLLQHSTVSLSRYDSDHAIPLSKRWSVPGFPSVTKQPGLTTALVALAPFTSPHLTFTTFSLLHLLQPLCPPAVPKPDSLPVRPMTNFFTSFTIHYTRSLPIFTACQTLCSQDFSVLQISVHGIFQERILEWLLIFLLQGLS